MVPGPRKEVEGKDRKPLTTWEKARELLWGLFFFDYWREMVGAQKRYEDATNLFLFGELLGLPFIQSVFTLRLLPYLLSDLGPWKLRSLREFDILQLAPDIH